MRQLGLRPGLETEDVCKNVCKEECTESCVELDASQTRTVCKRLTKTETKCLPKDEYKCERVSCAGNLCTAASVVGAAGAWQYHRSAVVAAVKFPLYLSTAR
jgi:hypothetical protein